MSVAVPESPIAKTLRAPSSDDSIDSVASAPIVMAPAAGSKVIVAPLTPLATVKPAVSVEVTVTFPVTAVAIAALG